MFNTTVLGLTQAEEANIIESPISTPTQEATTTPPTKIVLVPSPIKGSIEWTPLTIPTEEATMITESFYTPAEVAIQLNISPKRFRKLFRSGKFDLNSIPIYKISNRLYFGDIPMIKTTPKEAAKEAS